MEFLQRSRHGTVYHFRRRVPRDLVARLGRRQIVVTTHTEVRALAVRRARALLFATDDLFTDLREMGKPTKAKTYRTDYGLAMEFDPASGRVTAQISDAKPEDEPAIRRIIADLRSGVPAPLPNASQTHPSTSTPTIAEATAAVLGDPNLKATTRRRYAQVFNHFRQHFGSETRLGDIPQERFATYADAVNLSLDWSIKTKTMYIDSARRLFTYYEARNGAVPAIKTRGLKLKRQTPARHDRDEYDLDAYRVVFANAAQYRTHEPHKWWVTVACAFLGCRLEEIAQAHIATDFAKDDASGIHYLKVEEGVGDADDASETSSKSVKSLSSWRRIPIHPTLISAGFLKYLEHELTKGAVTPFARYWSPQRDRETGGIKHSHPITKWGGSELKKLRIAHPELPRNLTYFHSMRHGFTTLLAKAGVSEEWRAALAGHRTGGMNAQVYNKASQDVASTLPHLKAGLKPLVELLKEATKT